MNVPTERPTHGVVRGLGGADERYMHQIDAEDPSIWPGWVQDRPADDLPSCQAELIDGYDRYGLHLDPEDRPPEFDATAAVAERLTEVGDPTAMTAGETGVGNLVVIQTRLAWFWGGHLGARSGPDWND